VTRAAVTGERRHVAITGMGAVSPVGDGFDALLDEWMAGRSKVQDAVARCTDFDPRERMTTKEVRRSDRMSQFALAAALQATEQAGWGEGLPVDPARIGCVLGTAFGGVETIQRQLMVFHDRGPASMSPLAIPNAMYNAPPSLFARRLGLRGPSLSVASACASGSDAVGIGAGWIRDNIADAVLVGGADASATDFVVSLFRVVGTLSAGGTAKPFDANRDGFAMGEGAAILVLEAKDSALERGAHTLGEVLGYASSSDGYHPTSPDPSGEVAARAIRRALLDAGVRPEEVDYLNAHGTGTRLNDHSETLAIKAALGAQAKRVPVSSLKSVTGHLMGASGALEAGATVTAMSRGFIPPTVNHRQADEGFDLDYVGQTPGEPPLMRRLADGSNRIALSNSLGFGGHNAVLCLAGDHTGPLAA